MGVREPEGTFFLDVLEVCAEREVFQICGCDRGRFTTVRAVLFTLMVARIYFWSPQQRRVSSKTLTQHEEYLPESYLLRLLPPPSPVRTLSVDPGPPLARYVIVLQWNACGHRASIDGAGPPG